MKPYLLLGLLIPLSLTAMYPLRDMEKVHPVIHSSSPVFAANINVKDFGAVGDGKHNDAPAIQQALMKVPAAGQIVYFPAGIYKISNTLKAVRKGTRMQFGKGAKLLVDNNSNGAINILADDCSVENAVIEGNGVSARNIYEGYGILLSAVSNGTVKNCTFSGISGCNIFLVRSRNKGCTACKITGNIISRPALGEKATRDGSAILIGYSGDGYFHTDNIISGNKIDGNECIAHGISILAHGNNNRIVGNSIKNCLRYGIVSYETAYKDSTLTKTYILNNIIEDIGAKDGSKTNMGMGIYLMKSHFSVVQGNTVRNALKNADNGETLGRGAIAVSESINCQVDGNTIINSGRYGITCIYAYNTSITNNIINGTKDAGLFLKNTNGNKISNNQFRGIGKQSIRGNFGNTARPDYATNGAVKMYKGVRTGNNIEISNNKFYSSSQNIINMSGEDERTGRGYTNEMNNISIHDNSLIGNTRPFNECINLKSIAPGAGRILKNKNE
jgi:putative cofactor-binding repeat protein/parallel beta-helix repeat protein